MKMTSVKLNEDDMSKLKEVKQTFGINQAAQIRHGLDIVRRAVNAPCIVMETSQLEATMKDNEEKAYMAGALSAHLNTLVYIGQMKQTLKPEEFADWFEAHVCEQNKLLSKLIGSGEKISIEGVLNFMKSSFGYHKQQTAKARTPWLEAHTLKVKEQ